MNWLSKYKEHLLLLLLLIVYGILQWRYINIDFWNDEVFTLKNFVFTSINNTVLDYPVPNNHVFFNLLSNIYLKIIGIENLPDLMDQPYKLRLLPFLFSIITIVFVFKSAKEIFNSTTAFLAVIVLITTIPFINFALQIRGYGLSTMFVSGIIFYVFNYLQKKNVISLIIVCISSALIIYTIPSNVYFVASVIGFLFLYLVYQQILNRKNAKLIHTPRKIIFLMMALIAGSLLSLAFYAPIFNEVFMNSYVDNYTVVKENQIAEFLPQVFLAFLTHRWVLAGFFVMGIIAGFKFFKTKGYFIVFSVLVLLLPFVFTYIRNDSPPVRVFEYTVPVFSLLMAAGIVFLWSLIERIIKYGWVLLLVIFIYSTVVFAMETKKIDNKLAECMKTDEKMQDLYYQYYLSYYHPAADLRAFKQNYYTDTTILVLLGSEPHDLPDYLDKFNIRTRSAKKLDTLLAHNDSLYVITSFSDKFIKSSDYNIIQMNQSPSYYSILKLKRNRDFLSKALPVYKEFREKYKDSVRFVFNISNACLVKEIKELNAAYILNNNYQKKAGELISFVNEKPYLCYFQTKNTSVPNPENLYTLIFSERNKVIDYKSDSTFSYKIVAAETAKPDSNSFYNDFEKDYSFWSAPHLTDNISAPPGRKSEKLNKEYIYSSTLSVLFQDLKITGKPMYKISGKMKCEKDKAAVLVMEVQRNKASYYWYGVELNDYYTGKSTWEKFVTVIVPEKDFQKDDLIKFYIWNNENNNVWVDDLRVEIK